MIDILYYNDLDFSKVKKQFDKTVEFLKKGNFKSAETKKMQPTSNYRAKLDAANRLLFRFASYEGRDYILLLEVILNHEYDKCWFLGCMVKSQRDVRIPFWDRSCIFLPIQLVLNTI